MFTELEVFNRQKKRFFKFGKFEAKASSFRTINYNIISFIYAVRFQISGLKKKQWLFRIKIFKRLIFIHKFHRNFAWLHTQPGCLSFFTSLSWVSSYSDPNIRSGLRTKKLFESMTTKVKSMFEIITRIVVLCTIKTFNSFFRFPLNNF